MAEIGKNIEFAVSVLSKGGLVAIPTETVYGLAANALDTGAVTRIYKVKRRPHFDPLIVHVKSSDDLGMYVKEVPDKARILAETFWPGPLTLLLPKKEIIPDMVTSGLDSVGIRVPAHPLTLALLEKTGFPLAAPSANLFGYISPTSPDHVDSQLGDSIEYILDGENCTVGIESTVIGFENDTPTIYRLGGLSVEDIEKCIGPVIVRAHSVSDPRAPGMLKSHYAPSKKLLLGNIKELLQNQEGKSVGVISFHKVIPGIDPGKQFLLSHSSSLEEAAGNLFRALRHMDALDIEVILAETVPEHGLGRAINDRLRRAAAE